METSEQNLISKMKNDCKIREDGHRNRFSKYKNLHIWIGLPSAFLATIAGSLTTINVSKATVPGAWTNIEIATLSVSWLVALFAAANTFLRPHEIFQGHREKASKYDVLLSEIFLAETIYEKDKRIEKLQTINMEIKKLKLSEPTLSDKTIHDSEERLKDSGDLSKITELSLEQENVNPLKLPLFDLPKEQLDHSTSYDVTSKMVNKELKKSSQIT